MGYMFVFLCALAAALMAALHDRQYMSRPWIDLPAGKASRGSGSPLQREHTFLVVASGIARRVCRRTTGSVFLPAAVMPQKCGLNEPLNA